MPVLEFGLGYAGSRSSDRRALQCGPDPDRASILVFSLSSMVMSVF